MTNLITEARELIEALHAGEYDDEYIGTGAYLMLDELCDALEKATAKNDELIRELSQLARESVERDRALARLEVKVEDALREQAERESGCEWCADNYDHRHKTMFRKGSDWNYEAKYCDMCGKRLEEHHDAD